MLQCQYVDEGLSALKYLSHYLCRSGIAERAIVDFDPDTEQVTFAYQDSKSRRRRRQTLPLVEFLWRLMIHVLPSGYRRVRDFGFLHGNAKRTRARWPSFRWHCGSVFRPRALEPHSAARTAAR